MSEYIIRRYRTDARPPAFTIAASETSPRASRAAAAYRQHDEAAIASTGHLTFCPGLEIRAPKGLESIAQALVWVYVPNGSAPEGPAENRVTHYTTLRGSDRTRKRRSTTRRRTIKEGNTTERGGDAFSNTTNTFSSYFFAPCPDRHGKSRAPRNIIFCRPFSFRAVSLEI
jgi:hypothetical protein